MIQQILTQSKISFSSSLPLLSRSFSHFLSPMLFILSLSKKTARNNLLNRITLTWNRGLLCCFDTRKYFDVMSSNYILKMNTSFRKRVLHLHLRYHVSHFSIANRKRLKMATLEAKFPIAFFVRMSGCHGCKHASWTLGVAEDILCVLTSTCSFGLLDAISVLCSSLSLLLLKATKPFDFSNGILFVFTLNAFECFRD